MKPTNSFFKNTKQIRFAVSVPLRFIAKLLITNFNRIFSLTQRLLPFFSKTQVCYSNKEFEKLLSEREKNISGFFIQENVIDWNFLMFQRPQQMALKLGEAGIIVLYISNNRFDSVCGFLEVAKNVFVTDKKQFEFLNKYNKPIARSFYSTSYLFSKRSKSTKKLQNEKLIFEYIDHISPEINGSNLINLEILKTQRDEAFAGKADWVITSSKQLFTEASSLMNDQDRLSYIPNGVDTLHFINPKRNIKLNHDFQNFCAQHEKIVGYFGAIAPWLWYERINEIVGIKKDIGFIFIGAEHLSSKSLLPKSNNFFYSGPISYTCLPAHASLFDICIIPFKPGDIAKSTSPLKLFEYFALGKPVVVTSDMSECTQFPQVLHADALDEWLLQIDKALSLSENFSFRSELQELAHNNDWRVRADAYKKIILN